MHLRHEQQRHRAALILEASLTYRESRREAGLTRSIRFQATHLRYYHPSSLLVYQARFVLVRVAVRSVACGCLVCRLVVRICLGHLLHVILGCDESSLASIHLQALPITRLQQMPDLYQLARYCVLNWIVLPPQLQHLVILPLHLVLLSPIDWLFTISLYPASLPCL